VVKVEIDEGVVGWGESGLSGREKAVVGAIEQYREFLVGRDPFAIGALWQELYRSQYFEGGRVLQAAISAIDIALYDIKGKALAVPVYQLLGGKQRDRIPTFASTSAAPGPAMITQAKMLVAQGWPAMRLSHAGHGSKDIYEPREHIATTAKWLVKARDMMPHNPLGPTCTAATLHFCAAVANFFWLEARSSPAESLRFDNTEFFPVQPRLVGTFYPVSDAPGLGIEVNEELIARQSFKFWEAPHLKRNDGSVTNW
jgi:L-alanine-DL-glutamate epimerase-like enolase superfamily enzyme